MNVTIATFTVFSRAFARYIYLFVDFCTYMLTQSTRQGKVKQLRPKTTPFFFSRENEELPQAGCFNISLRQWVRILGRGLVVHAKEAAINIWPYGFLCNLGNQ